MRNTKIILNVKVYCLAFPHVPEYDSRLTFQEISDLFVLVNAVWECAHIRWKLTSCQKRNIDTNVSAQLAAISKKKELRRLFGQILPVAPLAVRERTWEVCLLDRFPVSIRSWGVYLPETKTVFLAESSRQNKPNAVTLAHELGHMLGLQHLAYDGNLMNPDSLRDLQDLLKAPYGIESQTLTEQQIEDARIQAKLGPY